MEKKKNKPGENEIIVNLNPHSDYELIDGERRLVACTICGLSEIEAVVKQGLTRAEMQKINTLSNIHRKDLTPLEKAFEAQKLMKEFGEGCEETAAAILGLTKMEMKLLANVSKLSPKWVKALKEGGQFSLIPMKHLALIARLPENVQEAKFDDIGNQLFLNIGVPVPLKMFETYLETETRKIVTFPFDTLLCAKCEKTSLSQVSIFPEATTKEDRCLDPICFEKKFSAYLIKAIKDAREEHGKKLVYVGVVSYRNTALQKAVEGMNSVYNEDSVKAGESADKRSFPVIFLSGRQAGEVFWRQFKKVTGGTVTTETPEEAEAQKKAGKERKGLIEKGKGLIAAIEAFWKANKDVLKKHLTKETVLAQKIILVLGTPENLWEADPTDWKLIHAPKEKLPEAFAARAVGIIQQRLQYNDRPGDIPFKIYYGEVEQVAKLINVDFEFIYEKYNPEAKKEFKEKKVEKK